MLYIVTSDRLNKDTDISNVLEARMAMGDCFSSLFDAETFAIHQSKHFEQPKLIYRAVRGQAERAVAVLKVETMIKVVRTAL